MLNNESQFIKNLLKKIQEKYREVQEKEVPTIKEGLFDSAHSAMKLKNDFYKKMQNKRHKNRKLRKNSLLNEDYPLKLKDSYKNSLEEIQNPNTLFSPALVLTKKMHKEEKSTAEASSMLFSALSTVTSDAPKAQMHNDINRNAQSRKSFLNLESKVRSQEAAKLAQENKEEMRARKDDAHKENSLSDIQKSRYNHDYLRREKAIFDCDSLVNSLNSNVLQK